MWVFMEKVSCLHRNTVHKCQNILKFMKKHSQFKQKLWKLRKFWPSNILYYSVYGIKRWNRQISVYGCALFYSVPSCWSLATYISVPAEYVYWTWHIFAWLNSHPFKLQTVVNVLLYVTRYDICSYVTMYVTYTFTSVCHCIKLLQMNE